MSIYSSKRNPREYRKIYIENYGPIPRDEHGRSYDIHHIDGNSSNNNPLNLVALSIKDHYNVHYSQGDYFSAFLIAKTMHKSFEEISNLAKLHAKALVESGRHNLLRRSDGSSIASDRVASGTHHLLGGEIQRRSNRERIANGTHNCLKKGKESPHYDHRIFKLAHFDGRTFIGTQGDFRQLYQEVNAGHFSRLISGDLKSTKGWKLISIANPPSPQ